ncbi:MAG: signal recognition particle protein [Deltaproteobacteria bacterium]|jgi:signal recognition particle subunit SRP54|nr:signal recognition particle protein [Deltaproteobacteria bacterium]
MFESLSDRLSGALRSFAGRTRLDEKTILDGLREVRLALLEADVNIQVVKDFTEKVKERCLDREILQSFTPAQQVFSIVNEELVALLGGETASLNLSGKRPAVIMMVGLQGSGKTTSTAKIAGKLRDGNHRPYLVPVDVYRPAAIDQLTMLARQLDMPVYPSSPDMNPVDIAVDAVKKAEEAGCDVLLLDTAGRLHIDSELMRELAAIKAKTAPAEILFVADAMTGQDAVTVAEAFNNELAVTGVVLTKMDGDARGGAALSIKSATGASVKFVGVGEKISDIETFHPDRIASRILGMGDMLTLMEKTRENFNEAEAEELGRKLQKAEFNLEDFLSQMKKLKSLGSIQSLLKLIPGMGSLAGQLGGNLPEKELGRSEAIINSMTPGERRNPKIINPSRRRRIASGSGTSVAQVNQLLKQFDAMRDMMRKASSAKGGLPRMGGLPGMGGLGGFPGMGGLGGMGGTDQGPRGGGLSKSALKKKKEKRKAERKKKKKR